MLHTDKTLETDKFCPSVWQTSPFEITETIINENHAPWIFELQKRNLLIS